MEVEWSKISKHAKISLFMLLMSSFIFIFFAFWATKEHDNSGIEDATYIAIPGFILALSGIIISLVFAYKALDHIKASEGKLKGKKLAQFLIVIDIILLILLFN